MGYSGSLMSWANHFRSPMHVNSVNNIVRKGGLPKQALLDGPHIECRHEKDMTFCPECNRDFNNRKDPVVEDPWKDMTEEPVGIENGNAVKISAGAAGNMAQSTSTRTWQPAQKAQRVREKLLKTLDIPQNRAKGPFNRQRRRRWLMLRELLMI